MFGAHMNTIGVLSLENSATYLTAIPTTLTVLGLNMISEIGRLGLVAALCTLPLSSSK